MAEIPVAAARDIAERYGQDQVVIIGRQVGVGGGEHVTTWGRDAAHCAVAARIGDFLKHKIMKWPRAAGHKRDWRLVADAPPAGFDVLLFVPESSRAFVVIGHRGSDGDFYEAAPAGEGYILMDVEPSHWMPLPAAPEDPFGWPAAARRGARSMSRSTESGHHLSGHLVLRAEGEFWNAYFARPGTMDGAVLLGSLRRGIVASVGNAKTSFLSLMMTAVAAGKISEITGEEARATAGNEGPMSKNRQKAGRLVLREEGEFWNAYYALPETMEDAVLLGSIRMRIVARSEEAKGAFMSLMAAAISEGLREFTGKQPE